MKDQPIFCCECATDVSAVLISGEEVNPLGCLMFEQPSPASERRRCRMFLFLVPLKNFICRFLKGGHVFEFERNIYGDEINHANGRSWWRCKKCGRYKAGQSLYEPPQQEESKCNQK